MAKKKRSKPSPPPPRRKPFLPAVAAAVVLLAAAVFYLVQSPSEDETTPARISASDMREALYLPAEFDPQDQLLVGGAQLAELYPGVLADIVEALTGHIRIRVLAGSATGTETIVSALAAGGLGAGTVEILELPILTMWLRDFGPLVVSDGRGNRRLVDFHYRERRGNELDDRVPGHLAQELGFGVKTSPLLLEGGDLLTNGLGFCLLSTRVINRNAHYLTIEPEQTVKDLGALLGFEGLYLVPPLEGESTGHVDMYCVFLAPDLVAVGRYDPEVDPENAALLDKVATDLADLETRGGPLRVERIVMPDHADGAWRTYTNVVFANDVLLVPVYPSYCPDLDDEALAFYRKHFPDREVIGIDASELIKMNGALRCITMNVPVGILEPLDQAATP
jgi:agmatine/peptidylarginine deiminase